MNYEQEEEYLTNDLSRKLAQVCGGRTWLSFLAGFIPACSLRCLLSLITALLFGVMWFRYRCFPKWTAPPPRTIYPWSLHVSVLSPVAERKGTVGADLGTRAGTADIQTDQEDWQTRERCVGQAVHTGEGTYMGIGVLEWGIV